MNGIAGVLFGLLLVVGGAAYAASISGGGRLALLLVGLFGLLFIYVGADYIGVNLREWLLTLLHRRAWQRLQITADGEIVDRTVIEHKMLREEHKKEYSYYETYWITFRFDSTEGAVALKARVDKPQYERLKGVETVMVRYALENPRLALLEGEWEPEY